MEWMDGVLIDLIAFDVMLLERRVDVWLNEMESLNGSVS